MRKVYENGVLQQVICNQCGQELKVENGILREGCFEATAGFGFFSKRDGEKVSFDLCESCFEKLVAQFEVPAEWEAVTEYL